METEVFYLFAPLSNENRLATGKDSGPLPQQNTIYLLNNYILSTCMALVPISGIPF